MGRKRIVDRDAVLDAAEAVVARDGAARLTLDAVAEQAGIGKATVLYDFKTKAALIDAVVERAVARDNAFNTAMTDSLAGQGDAVIRGRILAAATPLPDDFRAVALNLCAALAQDASLRGRIQENQRAVIAGLTADAASPRGALLAYLALEGLKLLEALDYHAWPVEQRTRILREINWLVTARPDGEAPLPSPKTS
ncbi:TetR/AcrR family transcriptional regulator [Caulobacter endophyticus]|uniref:TetR/AcrR family transcriptional regulator n=1 Tax=Caulobacter endophyticus TaxID=2172652 RepID=A0A2T9K831_9CAUL|nr:TetR/AcrR family transcriptional regulator [Caulobacter endophyticus]PVM91961.1 TetR/AcrR family transcriptional regulator [Caulobacter endophyticus]